MKCTTITLAIIVLLANFAQTAYVKAPTHIEANALLTVADPEPSCPYPSEDLTFYPDPSDCSKYFECYEGNKYSITCPSDMYWDTSNSMCAAKESVNCGDRGISTADPVTTTTTPITSTTETPEAPTTTTATTITPVTPTTSTTTSTAATTAITGPTPWTPDPLCPYPSEDLTFFPNVNNCSQYWECYEGNKYLITCPNNLVWNDNTNVCDDPRNVNCDRTTTTKSPNTGPTDTPDDSRCIGKPNGSFVADPDDCSKFYECNQGIAIAEQCPGNTVWNEAILTCDYPENVALPTSTTPDPLCPYPSDDITYFPDPYNCSQYYECYRGRKFLVSCPSDMYWSSHANLCEPQANVDCDDRSTITSAPITNTPTTSSPTVSSTTTSTAATTTSSQRPTETTETTVTVTPTTWTPDPECPYPSDDLTYFPDPYNCSQYYECYRGRKFLVSCPSDMYWSSHANLCELQAYVDCDDRSTVTSAPITNTPTSTSAPTDPSTISSTTSTTAATTTSPETPTETTPTVTVTPTTWTPDPECPYPSDDLTYFPDPYNCSQYYECYRGRKFLVSCPSDMYWSSQANLCELQANVDCDDRSTITSGPITNTPTSASTVTITTTTTASTITSSQTPTATTAPTVTATATTWTPDPQCPYPSDDLTYFPDPSNCSQYYECYRGRKFLVSCPSDMYWSSHANLCELQANVDCDDRSTVTSAPITNTPTPTSAPTDPLTVTSTTTTTAPTTTSPQTPTETPTVTVTPTTWTPDPQCPYPSDDLTYFPDPYNCSRYYECYRGRKFLVSCPSDMYWSSHANLCELQANVDCDDRSSPTTTTVSTTTSTETSTETIITTVTAAPTTSTPDPQCPYPSDDLTYYPHPSNCSQYYECYRGKKYLESCPSDMYWDTQAEICELREYVNCDGRSSTSHALRSLLTSTESPTDTTTPANEIICPYPSEDLIFYPNEDDCSQYWECYEGNKYLITCPSGLLWNIQTNMCDYEQNVNCTNNNSTTTKSPNTGPTENPDDRCIGQPDGSFHANLDDCSKFYECVESKPVDEQCPNNTLWNQAVLSCDYPSNVVCNN